MKDKSAKIILIGLGIYLAIMLIIFLPSYLRNKRDNLYILSGNFVKIKYENGKWSNIRNNDDYRLKEFTVYENNEYKGKYKLLFSNQFYLYDDGKKVDYNGQLFAYRGSLKLSLYGVSKDSELMEADQYSIQKALSSVGLDNTNTFNLYQKISLDVDKDGIIENIYCINNYYVENVPDQVFSIIFISKNNEVSILEKKVINSDEIYKEPSFEIHQVLDIRDDKKMELLFTKNYFSQPEEECAIIYKMYGKKNKVHDFCN